MALNFADRLVSNNPSAYGIVRAIEVSGHKTVSSLSALYKIPDCILSDSGNNTDNDSIGQLWYVVDQKEVYQLIDWEKRNNAEGWKSYLSEQVTDEELEKLLATKQDKLTAGEGINISEDNVISCTIDTSLFRMVDELPPLEEAETNKIYLLKKENNIGELQSYTEYIVSVTLDEEGKEVRDWEKIGEYDLSVELAPYLKIEDAEKTYVKKENIVDSFEGGDPKEKVLSAERGKELKELIDSLEDRKVDSVTSTKGKGIIVEGTHNDPTIGILLDPESEEFLSIKESGLNLSGVQNAIDAAVGELSDRVDLESDIVYNINEIFPYQGDGEDKNTWTIQWAIAKLDSLLSNEKKVEGIKCKFLSINGKWRTYTYYGGYFLDKNNWNYDLTSKDFVELATKNLPTATSGSNGVMSKEDKSKFDRISEGIGDGSIVDKIVEIVEDTKEVIDNYTVNGYKISTNPSLTRDDVGLGNVTNDAQVKRSEMGVPSGVATLGEDGKIPETQLPDSVLGNVKYQGVWDATNNIPKLELNDFESVGHYYISINKGSQFGYDFDPGDWVINSNGRWVKVDNVDSVKSVNGQIGIVELGIKDIPGLEDALESKTTDEDFNRHITDFKNPHKVTKEQVGLGNVDNTSDADKPVSKATKSLIDSTRIALETAINDLTIKSETNLEAVKAELNNKINSLASKTENDLASTKKELETSISNLANKTEADITATNNSLNAAKKELQTNIDKLAVKSETDLNNAKTELNQAISDLASKTEKDLELAKTTLEKTISDLAAKEESDIKDVNILLESAKKELETSISELATKSENDLKSAKSELENKISELSVKTEADLSTLRADLESSISVTKTDLESKINDLSTKTDSKFQSTDSKIDATKVELQTNIDKLSHRHDDDMKDIRQEIEDAVSGSNEALNNHISDKENPHKVTKSQVGLGNVTDDAQVKRSEMGIAGGVATLGEDGKVPAAQLPSFVDDVIEVDSFDLLPEIGESGKIYVTKDTNLTYRWSGSQYIEISESLALGETSSTAYPGDKGKETTDKLNSHLTNQENPHKVTAEQVGLGKVDNTADLDKPVSNATQKLVDDTKKELEKIINDSDGQLQADIDDVDGRVTKIENSIGVANGLATLDQDGKVPSAQLPSFVDDVLEVDSFDLLPEIGESGKIYITKDTNLLYRWTGIKYVEVSESLHLGETQDTAYAGDKGKETTDKLNEHVANQKNPHNVTKDQVGLGNVDNTADIDKPVSTEQQKLVDNTKKELLEKINNSEGDLKEDINKIGERVTNIEDSIGAADGIATLDKDSQLVVSQIPEEALNVVEGKYLNDTQFTNAEGEAHTPRHNTIYVDSVGGSNKLYRWDGFKYVEVSDSNEVSELIDKHAKDLNNPHQVTAEQIGLGNVDNTADYDKPVSKATQDELDKLDNRITTIDNSIGAPSGLATLDGNGKLSDSQIPEKTINVVFGKFVSEAEFKDEDGGSITPRLGVIYVDSVSGSNKIYRWSKYEFVEISNTEKLEGVVNSHVSNQENPHNVTKDQVGLGNVTNDAQVKRSEMGIPGGVATLDENGKIPESQYPGQIEEVVGIDKFVSKKTDIPSSRLVLGTVYYVVDEKKIYVAISDNSLNEGKSPKKGIIYCKREDNTIYRWDGADLVEIGNPIHLGETAGTAYPGDKGKETTDKLNEHVANQENPHNVTKEQVGLGKVDNTSDADKPISTATQEALDNLGKEISDHKADKNNPHEVTKEQIGLGNVENTADIDKPVSTATQKLVDDTKKELDTKIDNHTSDFNNPHQVTKEQVGLSNVDNTADINKPVSVAQQALVDSTKAELKQNISDVEKDVANHIADKNNPHEVNKLQVGLGNVDNTSDINKPVSTAQQAALDKLKSDLESIIGSTGTDLSTHIKDFDNPHKVTKDQVGLGKVDNTTDLEKPVSVAQQEAINTVQSNLDKTNTTLDNHIADKKNPHDVTKDQVGLGNVDNTADIDKPVSHYQQDALDELERRLQGSIDGSGSDLSDHIKDFDNPHKVTKEQVGLGNVDNTSDKNKPVSDATQKALDTIKTETNTLIKSHIADKNNPHEVTKEQVGLGEVTNDAQVKRSEMGVAGGVATLDQDGKVPSSQLPSFVDDVIEVDSYDNLPTTGEAGKIYVTKDTNLTYRWSGTKYTEISASLALGETSSTAYPGDKGKETTDKVNVHVSDFNNPHQVNKEQVGLGNVDNTSDLDKPVSNATRELVDKTKEELTDLITSNEGGLSDHIKDFDNPHKVTKEQVGLGNVDNTSDKNKPISNATQEALDNITNNITSIEDKLGQPNGIATLDPEGKVPSSQLPSFVDDVIEVDSFDLLPETGETGKIYVTKDTNLTYRWSGSRYIEISASLALGETSSTAYPGDKGKATTDKVNAHTADYNNPHKVDKTQVGLGNVDNTSDADKPVSDATQKLVDDTKKELEELITSNEGGLSDHIKDLNNPHKVTAEQLGLGNVDNTSDIDKPISNATQEALDNITNNITNIEEKIGKPNGIASLDSEGKVPASQLPSYVDDVIEVDSYDNLPVEGEAGKIYVTKDTNLTYRWSGTKYTEISASLALGETSSTAYPGDKGKATTDKVDSHVIDYNNPHKVDKTQVGLGNVDNTSDKDKPVSDATLTIIKEVKESISSGNTTITDNLNKHISDYNNPHKVTKDQVGLGNVDNTSDKDKPLSDAVKEAIKEVKDSIVSSGTDLSAHIKDYTNPHRVTKDQVGLGNVDNTADIDKPVSTATQKELDKLDAKIDKINTDQGTDLSDHLKDYNNPHKVTKDQVGLGNVDNTSDKNKPISDATQKAIDDAIASGNTALDNHANRTDNPHKVTKDQVGLGNVDNTADTVKPVSVPQQAALDALSNSLNTAINNHVSNINNPHQVTKDQVGLGKVNNTSDLEKPISVATQGAINTLETSLTSKITEVSTNLDKHIADKNNPHEVTKEQIGLGRVDNTSDKEKPISDATQAALDKKVDLTPDNKVPEDQLPVRTMHSMYYKGLWDAKLNSPVLNNGNKNEDGDYYLVTNGGERFGYVFMSSDIVFNASGSWYRLMGSNQRDEKTKFEIVSFTADRYEIERGESASITFDWEYQMTPDGQVNFQFLNEYNVPVEDRTYTVTEITQDKEFILNGSFLNETAQASLEIKFYDKFYVGTSSNATASNEDLHKMDAYFVNGKDQAPLKDFDCSGGKYIYVAIPSDSKDKYKIFSNNMLVTDTVDTTRTVTNASGGTAEYVISRFANKYNGVLSIEVKLID